MLERQTPFQKSARVDARAGVALKIDEVSRLIAYPGAEEMIESDLHQRGDRGVGGDVTADAGVFLVLLHDHRHRVPSDDAFDLALYLQIAGVRQFVLDADSVPVRRIE